MKKDIPKELLEKRETVECNFVLSLYKNPDLITDYKNVINGEDIITEDGQFYYGIAQGMYKAGYNVFDNMSIYTYLEDKKVLKDGFERRGGYGTIKEITALLSEKNLDSYYDELCRGNLLIRLHQAGFNVMSKLDKLKQMSTEEVYDYYEYKLANISLQQTEKAKVEDLSSGYDEWIVRASEAKNVGFRVGSKLLDYQLAGIHKGALTLYAGGIGCGKSSSSVPLFILPTIEDGNDICIVCNEQTSDEYRNMIVASVLFSKIKDVKGMNRMSITLGNFDDYKISKLKEAAEWIEKQPGKIKFVEMQNYDVGNVKKVIKRQAKLGCSYFIFDVLKNVNDASEKAWAELSDIAKALFLLAKNENIAILCTVQLASDSMYRKFLDLSAIGKSRALSEPAATVLGFRVVQNNEIDKLKPWQWKKNDDGTNSKIKEIYDLSPEKHYIIQFIMKNRWGNLVQIVQEFNQSFNTLKDVGYISIDYDDFRR